MGGGRKGLRTLGLKGGRAELETGGGEVGISTEVSSTGESGESLVVGASLEKFTGASSTKDGLEKLGSLTCCSGSGKIGAGCIVAVGSTAVDCESDSVVAVLTNTSED